MEEVVLAGAPVLGWCQLSPETVYGFYFLARQRVKAEVGTREKAEKIVIRPHVDTVWRLFDAQRTEAIQAAREHLGASRHAPDDSRSRESVGR